MTESIPRIVGVDYGLRRTGIAVADPLRMFARVHGTYTPDQAIDVLVRIHADEGISRIVLGWPLMPNGEEGEMVGRVRTFEKGIRRKLPEVPIERWDERFSSVEARELMLEAGVRKKRRREKARLDAAAAAVILQSYLDAHVGK